MPTERLSSDDARILALESPAVLGHTCKVAVLAPRPDGGPIEIEELREHVAARLGRVPRCRQRVASVPMRVARPAWVDDPGFEIAEHVQRFDGGRVVSRARLRRVAGELMSQRLDHTRPLWRMDLVGPTEDGGSAIVWRIHHCMADGVTAIRLGEQILWEPEDAPAPPSDEWSPAPAPSGAALLSAATRDRIGALGHAIPAAARGIATPRRWASAVRSAGRLPGAMVRELTPLSSPSNLDRHIGSGRELVWTSYPIETLHGIGSSIGERIGAHVTINDVVLGAISGGLRGWLGADGADRGLRAQVPVSLHHRDEAADELGNRDSFLFVDLPLDEADPVRRVQRINSETRIRKQAHDAEELYDFFHAVSRLGPAGRKLIAAASGPKEFSLSVSNVPGPRRPVYVLGAEITELCSVAEPADRHALRVSALSCAGTMQFGLCTDPDALAGLGHLAAEIDRAVEELGARS